LRRKILLTVLLLVVVLVGLGLYVGGRAVQELSDARSALTATPTELSAIDISTARDHLRSAADVLDGLTAQVLSVVPVARQNLAALEAAVRDGIPVLDAAIELRQTVENLGAKGLMDDGRIQLDAIHDLRRPLRAQIRMLDNLIAALESHRSGWLLPALWDEVDGLHRRARRIQASARRATRVMAHADALLGVPEPRTYLVVLINNAELRAAGGIPSGLGTITVSDGSFELGDFYYAPELRDPPPYERVPAPRDFRRRFAFYGADSRFWVNTTFSPDIPDVALVSARLFRAATGIRTNGVLIADPRGVAALMDPSATIAAPETGRLLTPGELPVYAYSGVYGEESTGLVADRHKALLQVGRLAFEQIATGDFGGADGIASAGGAFAGGHLRFISFDSNEQEALNAVGITGNLDPPKGDNLLVTAWNSGGDKLDYWARRRIDHSCVIPEGDQSVSCSTVVAIRNIAPEGLSETVANRPYGLMKSFVELYIPKKATLKGVLVNGEPTQHWLGRQDGLSAVGVYVRIRQGEAVSVKVAYDLRVDGQYSLRVIPQPLAVDARLQISLRVPPIWRVRGLTPDGNRFTYEGLLDRTLFVDAKKLPSRSGIPGLWDRLLAFWREPVF
jgi:hypothetical protein